jgi:hypothetical protein
MEVNKLTSINRKMIEVWVDETTNKRYTCPFNIGMCIIENKLWICKEIVKEIESIGCPCYHLGEEEVIRRAKKLLLEWDDLNDSGGVCLQEGSDLKYFQDGTE